MPRDFTKYQFNGQVYGKGRLVLAVLQDYVSREKPSLKQLMEVFPTEVQGRKGIFCTENEYSEKLKISDDVTKRFFNKEDEKLAVEGQKILVSTQWGEGNISQFIERSNNLGIHIEITKNNLTHEEVIQEFVHHNPFKQNYKNWSEDTLNSFCKLMLFANEMSLDIFTTKMSNGGSIRIGRKGNEHSTAQEVLATFEPQAKTVIYRRGELAVPLSSDVIKDICNSDDMQNFAQRLPISRDAYWPSDYINTSANKNSRIWKVSHSPSSFNVQDLHWLTEHQMLAVHESTGNGSADNFREMGIGDIVSLGHGNTVFRLVRVLSDVKHESDSPFEEEWLMRDYEVIKTLDGPVKYKGLNKRWSPRFNGTSWEVPKNEFSMFETEILKPYYGLTLEDLGFDTVQMSEFENKSISEKTMKTVPLNQILYGPPGTGKTYHSVQAAVKAAEPEVYRTLNINENTGTTAQQREELTRLYKELFSAGRIKFVTFHQSYGYEEFVEGLSANAEGNQLTYFVKDGIFKTICEDAKAFRLEGTTSVQSAFDKRWQHFSEILAESESGVQVQTLSKKTHFTITDISNNTIRFDKSKGDSVHTLSVKTLKAVYNNEKEIIGGLQPYYGALIQHLNQISITTTAVRSERKNFVLIIDEINRGNISKIFGELITLIEPSKRLGQPEGLEVFLPYSGDAFSVPDNLYLIGTMNTADRSLALMDTALRRRFDFVEMMPDYSVLHDDNDTPYCVFKDGIDINLVELLRTLNKRITALYDREHSLGHAFLMPVVAAINQENHSLALEELARCFQNKIIPLLAEYFFEDWQKIRLVLGDNQKEQKKLDQLIQRSVVEFESLFGDTDELELMEDNEHEYRLISADSPLWFEPQTYVGMYDLSQVVG